MKHHEIPWDLILDIIMMVSWVSTLCTLRTSTNVSEEYAGSSERVVSAYQTNWLHIPEDSHLNLEICISYLSF